MDVRREAKMWKRKNADQRVKRSFKTAGEVLQEAEAAPAAVERQTIIDMRGPQVRAAGWAGGGWEGRACGVVGWWGGGVVHCPPPPPPQARLVTNLEHLDAEDERGDGGTGGRDRRPPEERLRCMPASHCFPASLLLFAALWTTPAVSP